MPNEIVSQAYNVVKGQDDVKFEYQGTSLPTFLDCVIRPNATVAIKENNNEHMAEDLLLNHVNKYTFLRIKCMTAINTMSRESKTILMGHAACLQFIFPIENCKTKEAARSPQPNNRPSLNDQDLCLNLESKTLLFIIAKLRTIFIKSKIIVIERTNLFQHIICLCFYSTIVSQQR